MSWYPTTAGAVSWVVLCLITASAVVAVDDHGIRRYSVDEPSVCQSSLGDADQFWDSAAPAVAPAPAVAISAEPVMQVELADPALASTAEQRELLTYLVRCALPEDVVLYAQHGPGRFTFQGRLGLAPGWLYEAMTPSEERWVSACLLAHVNYFGQSVLISLRATPPVVPGLAVSADEQHTFTIFEGGFFGNLFLPTPVAYTCQGDRTPAQERDPILQDRVCTHGTGTTTAAGAPITFCRLLVTGRCNDAAAFIVEDTHYSEVLFTYLRPHMP